MATLSALLPLLKTHTGAILVTGPQRSGTTIGGRILAHELSREYVDEEAVRVEDEGQARSVLARPDVVLQAPGLCHVAHTFGCAVVLMRRAVADIVRSQRRIGWGFEGSELAKYQAAQGPIAHVKYRAWDEWQKDRCVAAFELDYDSLRDHPLWIDAERRTGFGPRQWRAGS